MSFKDKPKREGGKPFDRDRKKPTAARKSDDGAFSAKKGGAKPLRKPAVDAAAVAAATADKPERISKILARAGVASRRDVERMIMEGRVSLNGTVLDTPVVNATLADKIEVDGQPIRGIERTRLWLYHKPAGLVTTNSDPEGRPTVFENLPEELPRVMSIGRLDINTEGLLLLTNDGGLSRVLELPTTGWLRRYRVRAHGEVTQEQLDKLKDGIAVDGVLYGAIDATLDRTQGHNVWITMGLREGKNREIKNVLGALGLDVNRLIRISYGPFQLGDLPEGHVVEARGRMLRDQLGPRLIEEAKANFDAPIYSNPPADEDKPDVKTPRAEKAWGAGEKRAGEKDAGEKASGARGERDAPRGERREGGKFGEKPSFGDRPRFGDKPKGRGDGKFAGKGKPSGKFDSRSGGRDDRFEDEKPKKRAPMGTSRTANVWMAPGARPTKDGGAGKTSARAEAERLFNKPTEAPRRPNINRVEGDSDWIRAEEAPAPRRSREEDGGGFRDRGERNDRGAGRGDRGDRAERGARPERGDRPFRSERPDRGDRPARAERPDRAERPSREGGERGFGRPQGDRSEGRGRPSGGRPSGGRSFGDRPERGDREGGRGGFGGKPGGRSFGGKPSGERSGGERSGERPAGKSFGGKPAGKFGGKPGGAGKPDGRPGGSGKPGGRPAGGRGPGSGSGGGPRGGQGGGKGPRGPRG
ncbi:pseudouridine synthase [Rhizobium sp. FKY42]|uniref:pseudouridine synthase n=1 Tax=Rhizobium sp. FKY42 TaxID=2562310 RepID=UPI0010C12F4B|nr:pseudouridine synthase [Rhizobium sp. FKY42]